MTDKMKDIARELLDALKDLLEHEGELVTTGIGIEIESEALEAARAKASAAVAKAEEFL